MKRSGKYKAWLLYNGDKVSDAEYFVAATLISAKATATRLFGGDRGMWECIGVREWVKDEKDHYSILLTRLRGE